MTRRTERRWQTKEPKTQVDARALCGFDSRTAEAYWDANADQHGTFLIVGDDNAEPLDTVRGWELIIQVTGENPDISPQPTGNCVAAAAGESVEFLQCSEIVRGDAEEFRRIYNPFHYATGRVLVMKNALKGSAGANGGAVAQALQKFGALEIVPTLPDYNKKNVDAWGDGAGFREFMPLAANHVVKETARVTQMADVFRALSNRYPLTIASNCGYEFEPGRDGFHDPTGNWSHQMSVWGYSISGNWVAVKNQWGDVHGKIVDHDGETWPPGFLKVRLDRFEQRHFRGSETIVYSNFAGFPQRRYDHRALT
jgi:hypothetical protein